MNSIIHIITTTTTTTTHFIHRIETVVPTVHLNCDQKFVLLKRYFSVIVMDTFFFFYKSAGNCHSLHQWPILIENKLIKYIFELTVQSTQCSETMFAIYIYMYRICISRSEKTHSSETQFFGQSNRMSKNSDTKIN